ncbi:MAG: phytol kinase [Marmoricola sp.]|nr:phytol kinase [Marmoricola sp.]
MALILTIVIVFALLIVSELWWRIRKPHDELSRKFVHITVGSFAAFWPYFLSWKEIIFLSIACIVVVAVSQYFGIFKAIHAVERPTWGEVCFAAAVGILAFVSREPLIYTIALLHMSMADGMAALVGTSCGKKNSYKVFGHKKSVAGSAAFLGVSMLLLLFYATVTPSGLSPIVVVGTAITAMALENIAVRGLDNLFVPVLVAGALILFG